MGLSCSGFRLLVLPGHQSLGGPYNNAMKEPALLRTTPVGFKIHSGTDIEIQENEEAQDIILSRPKCTVQRLACFGMFESDYKEY